MLEMNLTQIIYCSLSRPGLLLTDFHSILSRAQINNAAKDITGLLVFDNQHFLQLIEGDAPVLDDLMAHIAVDARHQSVQIIERAPIDKRHWSNWSMVLVTGTNKGIFKRYHKEGLLEPYKLQAKQAFNLLLDLTAHVADRTPTGNSAGSIAG